MKKLKLIIGTHNSQPVGSYDYVFERAYQEAYKPFLTIFYNYSDIPITLYYSGTLLQWLEDHHPEFLMLLDDMVKQKQVELLSGGFYDPIFPIIPPSDRIGQIEKLTTYLRKKFGKRPAGSWVTELVWEPCLTSMFKTSGINYIFLDESHFEAIGFSGVQLYQPCITEDQGKTLIVYPISSSLGDRLIYEEPDTIINKLLTVRDTMADEAEELVVVLFTPGEKYGLYRDTSDICYKQQWLERFLQLLSENRDAIEVTTPGKQSKAVVHRRRGYFPCTASRDMTVWLQEDYPVVNGSKHEENNLPVCSRGFFRSFLSKYSESNLLYSKMVYTNILVNQIRGDKSRKKAAREELWEGQSNFAYWHGNHAGVYENFLRKAAYNALIEAEKTTHEKGVFIPSIIKTDFDLDGQIEYLFQGHELNGYVHLNGGILFELDYLPISWNYLDTMNRYREPYHGKDIANNGYDHYLRKAFVDHFFSERTTVADFDCMQYHECGDFIGSLYNDKNINRDRNELKLERSGAVICKDTAQPLKIEKRFIFKRNAIDVYYILTNLSERREQFSFGSEINLSFLSNGMESQRIYKVVDNGRKELGPDPIEDEGIVELEVTDLYNDVLITLSSAKSFRLWSLPVYTTVRHHQTVQTIYQSNCFVPSWEVELASGESWETRLSLRFDQVEV